jgi:hypothetical protein
MANSEWGKMASSERRAASGKNGEWRMANSEWKKTASSEQRAASGEQ